MSHFGAHDPAIITSFDEIDIDNSAGVDISCGQPPKRHRIPQQSKRHAVEGRILTPPFKFLGVSNRDKLSPSIFETKVVKTTETPPRSGTEDRHHWKRQRIVDIDEVQSRRDPNYNSTYAWSIARMKQDEEELYVQCAPNENGVGLQNNWSSSGDDIVYPSICSNSRNFPAHQTDINAGMHSTLVDWLVDECGSYGVQASTWCLCVHIMDEYLRRVADVPTYRFQLLGCACLLLAAKLEQATCPLIDDLVVSSNECFLRGDVIVMERDILAVLEYNISLPTRLYFLNRFLLAVQVDACSFFSSSDILNESARDDHMQHALTERNYKETSFAHFLMDITLQNYGFNQYPMSVVAAAIVHYVKQFYRPLSEIIWTPTLVFYTGYEERHLIPVVFALQSFHAALFDSDFESIESKYNCLQYRHCSLEMAMSTERIRFDDREALHSYMRQDRNLVTYREPTHDEDGRAESHYSLCCGSHDDEEMRREGRRDCEACPEVQREC